MTASTRTAPAAFGRGMSQVVANPGLLLAPLAFGAATVLLLGGSTFAAALAMAGSLRRIAEPGRGPQ